MSSFSKTFGAATLMLFSLALTTGCAPIDTSSKADEKIIIGLSEDSSKSVKHKDNKKEVKDSNKTSKKVESVKSTSKPKPTSKPKASSKPEVVKKESKVVSGSVHPGSYCTTPGAKGKTKAGTSMTCKKSDKDNRERWRKS